MYLFPYEDEIIQGKILTIQCEIDHQIAKCLDTLDRQGLKFLKETLRASKIFGLNTQELGNSQPLEEEIEDEGSEKIKKEKEHSNKKV